MNIKRFFKYFINLYCTSSKDVILDKAIDKLLNENKVTDVKYDGVFVCLYLSNGYVIKGYNSTDNHYNNFFDFGSIYDSYDENSMVYNWGSGRPSTRTMRRILEIMDNHLSQMI